MYPFTLQVVFFYKKKSSTWFKWPTTSFRLPPSTRARRWTSWLVDVFERHRFLAFRCCLWLGRGRIGYFFGRTDIGQNLQQLLVGATGFGYLAQGLGPFVELVLILPGLFRNALGWQETVATFKFGQFQVIVQGFLQRCQTGLCFVQVIGAPVMGSRKRERERLL